MTRAVLNPRPIGKPKKERGTKCMILWSPQAFFSVFEDTACTKLWTMLSHISTLTRVIRTCDGLHGYRSTRRQGRFSDAYSVIFWQIFGLAWPTRTRTDWDRLVVCECRYDIWNPIRLQDFDFLGSEYGEGDDLWVGLSAHPLTVATRLTTRIRQNKCKNGGDMHWISGPKVKHMKHIGL